MSDETDETMIDRATIDAALAGFSNPFDFARMWVVPESGSPLLHEPAALRHAAALRYWDLWPAERDALERLQAQLIAELLEEHKTDLVRLWKLATKKIEKALSARPAPRDGSDPLIPDLDNDTHRLVTAHLRHSDNVLVHTMFVTADGIAADPVMFRWFKDATDDELRRLPPVGTAKVSHDGRTAPAFHIFSEDLFARLLPDEPAVVAAFDALERASKALGIADATRAKSLRYVEEAYVAAKIAAANAVWKWHERGVATDAAPDKMTTTPGLFDGPLQHQTFYPLNRVTQAYSDSKAFRPTRDGRALVHSAYNEKTRKKDPIDVVLEPLEDPGWLPPATVKDLEEKLARIGAWAPFTFAVTVDLAIRNDRVTLELDDFIRAVGLDPRSKKERHEYRGLLWDCLQLFSQTSAVGELRGHYRDETGNAIERIERSPVIAITGKQYPQQMQLDGSEVPDAVSFVAGEFFYRHRTNRKLLAYLGDLRQLAAIPAGKASGQWARSIGLAVQQHWREYAAGATTKYAGEENAVTLKIKSTTRRELFSRIRPNPDPFEILKSPDPGRARKYSRTKFRFREVRASKQLRLFSGASRNGLSVLAVLYDRGKDGNGNLSPTVVTESYRCGIAHHAK